MRSKPILCNIYWNKHCGHCILIGQLCRQGRLETLIKAYGPATIRGTGNNHISSLRHKANTKYNMSMSIQIFGIYVKKRKWIKVNFFAGKNNIQNCWTRMWHKLVSSRDSFYQQLISLYTRLNVCYKLMRAHTWIWLYLRYKSNFRVCRGGMGHEAAHRESGRIIRSLQCSAVRHDGVNLLFIILPGRLELQ